MENRLPILQALFIKAVESADEHASECSDPDCMARNSPKYFVRERKSLSLTLPRGLWEFLEYLHDDNVHAIEEHLSLELSFRAFLSKFESSLNALKALEDGETPTQEEFQRAAHKAGSFKRKWTGFQNMIHVIGKLSGNKQAHIEAEYMTLEERRANLALPIGLWTLIEMATKLGGEEVISQDISSLLTTEMFVKHTDQIIPYLMEEEAKHGKRGDDPV